MPTRIRGVEFIQANFAIERVKIVAIGIEHESGPTELTMVSGMLAVPDVDEILYYGSRMDAQAELWSLALQHLGQSDAP